MRVKHGVFIPPVSGAEEDESDCDFVAVENVEDEPYAISI